MKKLLFTSALATSLILAACGSGEESTENEDNSAQVEQDDASMEEVEAEEVVEETEVETETEETETEVGDDEEAEVANVKSIVEGFEIAQESVITKLVEGELGDMTVTSEDAWYFDDKEVGDIQPAIILGFEVENTVEEPRDFYLDQTTIVTNTGEQLESEWMMDSGLQSEMIGAVKSSGEIVFLPKADSVEGIEWVDIIIPSILDEEWNTLAEEQKVRIEFK